ncbi:PepSY domain-containing protein [Qipengyuania sp. JC766]|uniref:PepSY domain-containing protein n=1 Tax=Qipengyuania sp. JC766 TaxID=3232139 RepID=UPI00345B1DCB
MKIKSTLASAMAIGTMVLAAPAIAQDRPPTAEERAAIEMALKDAGFVSWEEIELDDDGPYWDIDDARTADGLRYDLKLAPDTLEIIERDLED